MFDEKHKTLEEVIESPFQAIIQVLVIQINLPILTYSFLELIPYGVHNTPLAMIHMLDQINIQEVDTSKD